jgi:CelD/BcsL family acetyltransferase involved in cellulose biosynthesis
VNAETLSLDDASWLTFVASCPDVTFFHRSSWARLLGDCYGFAPRALVVRDGTGRVQAGVPFVQIRGTGRMRWVALPFTDHCGVLGAASAAIVAQLDGARARAGADSLEIRGAIPDGSASHVELTASRHTLDLTPGSDAILQAMDRMHRGSLRKAERADVRIEEAGSAGLDDFYRLHLRTRRRLGVPIQPRKFFRLVKERILDQGDGFVLRAHVGGTLAAAGVFFVHERTLVFKYSASDERIWQARPNHELAWWAIRAACERGFTLFDWGRTDITNDGLRTYKRAFGSREEPLPYSWLGRGPRGVSASPLRRSLSVIIRRSPNWVCQAFGETFYRYAS